MYQHDIEHSTLSLGQPSQRASEDCEDDMSAQSGETTAQSDSTVDGDARDVWIAEE